MQAYPIRGSVYDNVMLLKGLPTSTVEVLTKNLTFKSINDVTYDECLLLTNFIINGGYAFANSLRPFEYLQYDNQTDTFIFSTQSAPLPLISSSASKLWNTVLTGVIYDLYNIKIRFLPSLLYQGQTLAEKKGQQVLDIEKSIITFNDPTVYYFTNTLDANENVLYRYSYDAQCKTFSKGYCSNLLPYSGSIDYTSYGACHNTKQGYECYTEDFNKIKQDNGKIVLFVVFLILGLILAYILISFRIIETNTSAVYRPEIYFDDNNIIDIDDWH